MSEYQIYEFQTVDRPLTQKEQEEISRLSSRVKLSRHRAVFTYSYSDFPGDAFETMAAYFDGMYYVANFGIQSLGFRFPKSLIDAKAIKPYLYEDCLQLDKRKSCQLLMFEYSWEEGFGWLEEADTLSRLIDLRQEIMEGDYRWLYLAWLRLVTLQWEDSLTDIILEDDALEPLVPPGLQTLTSAQKAFVEVFEIDSGILAAAQQASEPLPKSQKTDWTAAIIQLSATEQQDFLHRLAEGETNLTRKFQKALRPFLPEQTTVTKKTQRRSVKNLFDLAVVEREKAKKLAAEKAKAACIKALKQLAPQESKLWAEVEDIMENKKGHSYHRAVQLLVDLKDLAALQQQELIFEARFYKLCDSYPPTQALARRLHEAQLQ